MKRLRHGPKGQERPALLDGKGQVRDLSACLPDIAAATLSLDGLAAVRALDWNAQPIVAQGRLAVPWSGLGMKPVPIFLKPGDTMRLGIDKLGEQKQTVHAWHESLIDDQSQALPLTQELPDMK